MSRILEIERCYNCPHEGGYLRHGYECNKIHREIPAGKNIPSWCPLPKEKEAE